MDDEPKLENYVVLIPNAIEPYGYELVNILAYPSGFQYRFRFDEEWVQEKLRNNIAKLNNKKGYIVLRDKDAAKFYPIRFCIIKQARKIGKIYYFEYELGDIIDYDSKENLAVEQIEDFNKKFSEFHKNDISNNNPNADMTPLCLFSNYELTIKNQNYLGRQIEREDEQWGNVVSAIKNIKLYENVEFIKLVDVISKTKKASISNYAFSLKEEQDYALRVLQYIPKRSKAEATTRDVQITVDENYITPIRAKHRAVGKYDVLTFLIRTKPGSGGRWSFIDLEHVAKAEAQPSIEPTIHFPVFIGKLLKRSLIVFCAIVILLLVYKSPRLLTQFLILDERTLKDTLLVGLSISLAEFLREIRGYLRK
ncbi:MAG: hypothetical protein M1372_01000 [Patescibacteria group bacterium]|nr:hypothetical protein [Patescibacteria group bacterium]